MTGKRVNSDELSADDPIGYDPYLGLAVADSWWALGRWVNRLRASQTTGERSKIAREWADEVNLDDDPAIDYAVSPKELIAFADTIIDLLERKFNGEGIASEVNSLVAPIGQVRYEDDETFLTRRENSAAFWALEYYFLFDDMERRDNSVWSRAVGYCDNEPCRKFFIRQRIDNRFDSEKCRTNAANRKYYKRRSRPHGGTK
jgi:hypothetical protein